MDIRYDVLLFTIVVGHFAVESLQAGMGWLKRQEARRPWVGMVRPLVCVGLVLYWLLVACDDPEAPSSEQLAEIERRRAERTRVPLEQKLHAAIVGQKAPILTLTRALRRRESGWHDPNKPLVLLFLGSSGVGKTMLAKLAAEHLADDPDNGFVRLDMSEYSLRHNVARLIGSPPGYVGHDDGGQLTSRLRKCPNAVVLLDEVEKAHPDVLTLMLQAFDEGRLTDGRGVEIHCPGAVFIMTTNLAQDEIRETCAPQSPWKIRPEPDLSDLDTTVASQTRDFLRTVVRPILKRHFKRDELLGRINDMLVFHPFSRADVEDMVEAELDRWAQKARERHGITVAWTATLVASLATGYDERYGFRSIRHEVEKRAVGTLVEAHEGDQLRAGSTCTLDLDERGHVRLTQRPPLATPRL